MNTTTPAATETEKPQDQDAAHAQLAYETFIGPGPSRQEEVRLATVLQTLAAVNFEPGTFMGTDEWERDYR